MTIANIPIAGAPAEELGGTWSCFVLGPLGDPYAKAGSPKLKIYEEMRVVYENVIQTACAAFGITPIRADELPSTGEIADQICRHVKEADLVIADLTGLNPNVIWELALRQGTGKPTIQLRDAADAADLPFYLAKVRTIMYGRTKGGLIEAREALRQTLELGIRNGFDILTPARILHGAVVNSDVVTIDEKEDALGLLDAYAQIEVEMVAIVDDLENLTASLQAIMEACDAFLPEISRLTEGERRPTAMLAVILRFATAISGPANDMDTSSKHCTERLYSADAGVRLVLAHVESLPLNERPEETNEILSSLIDLEEIANEAIGYLLEMSHVIDSGKDLSRQLRKPLSKITSAVARMASANSYVSGWGAQARSLLATPESSDTGELT
ncbi:hypothetical protein [Rhizohabitans arisaemae]|uniref:hypothetical protein n=1 Tax=Rhizohabitans arisaemae TaxID=2720610 RepID=UPI0024B0EB77|nr:hypothetical protein [Rhizohabitans arisaemae]